RREPRPGSSPSPATRILTPASPHHSRRAVAPSAGAGEWGGGRRPRRTPGVGAAASAAADGGDRSGLVSGAADSLTIRPLLHPWRQRCSSVLRVTSLPRRAVAPWRLSGLGWSRAYRTGHWSAARFA